MKLLYLGYFCSDELFNRIVDNGVVMSHARQRFEMNMIKCFLEDGLIDKRNITIVSYLPSTDVVVPDTEIYYGKEILFVKAQREAVSSILDGYNKCKKHIKKWLKETQGEKRIVLTYATNPVLLLPLLLHRPSDLKIVTICSEIPWFRQMIDGNNKFKVGIKRALYTAINKRMSAYILLTKQMNEVCNSKNKPWIVVEGMAQLPPHKNGRIPKNTMKDIVFYAGGLSESNGTPTLIDAFLAIQRENTELWLCGIGECANYVQQKASENSSIKYLGVKTNVEVLKLEQEATLLVNPRKRDNKLTRYSFPSKTLEYFASGTPSLITRLEGIPDEYYQYCYVLENFDQETISTSLCTTLNIPLQQRQRLGEEARTFVERSKTPLRQSSRIIEFLIKTTEECISSRR